MIGSGLTKIHRLAGDSFRVTCLFKKGVTINISNFGATVI